MGASSSKAVQKGARQFPKRAPGTAAPPRPPPTSRPAAPAPADPAQPPRPTVFAADQGLRTSSTEPAAESMTPAFSARLRQMGVAQPNPTFSPSSTFGQSQPHAHPQARSQPQYQAEPSPFGSPDDYRSAPPAPAYPHARDNQTLNVLESRRRLQARADAELENLGRASDGGREFLDVATIRRALLLRQKGEREADIEARLRLRPGAVARLAGGGVVQAVEGGAE